MLKNMGRVNYDVAIREGYEGDAFACPSCHWHMPVIGIEGDEVRYGCRNDECRVEEIEAVRLDIWQERTKVKA